MKIKVQTRKLTAGCSKYSFEVADKTDEVSSKHCFEVVDKTDEVSNHIYGKVKLTWFEEIFEEYYLIFLILWLRTNPTIIPTIFCMKFGRISGRAAAQPFIKVEPKA